VAFALGALVHDATVGGRMWAYHEAQAQAQAEAQELAFERNALEARKVDTAAIHKAMAAEAQKSPEQRAAEDAKVRALAASHPLDPSQGNVKPLPPVTD
jgi:hypothetical protein